MTNSSHLVDPLLTSFSERFALASFDDEAVLLDLATGALHSMNLAAASVCAALARGESPTAAAEEVARSFGLPVETAIQAVDVVRSQLGELQAGSDGPTAVVNPISFDADQSGMVLRLDGEPILRTRLPGFAVSMVTGTECSEDDAISYLQWAAPHLLALQHQPVLHASAVHGREGVLAFSGASGAGKTTTSHLFVAAGHRPVSEDLLIVTLAGGVPVVFVEGEEALRRWVREKGVALASRTRQSVDASELSRIIEGAASPLKRMIFLDASRRSSAGIVSEVLQPAEALVHLLQNGFAELAQRDIWLELFTIASVIARQVPCEIATVPEGLKAYEDAIRAYSVNSAS